MKTPDENRNLIVNAAGIRFTRFGYGKTTMAEIAADCDMSVGNLYRFFPGKLDLAAEIVDRSTVHAVATLRKAASRRYKSAAARLEALTIAELRETHDVMENRPTIAEMGRVVMERRVEIINKGLKDTRAVYADVLADGVASGEFEIDDPDFAAEMIQAATLKFRYPQLWSFLSLPALEREARSVIRLFVSGLKRP
jgi:AcrR family transcriptional regulator